MTAILFRAYLHDRSLAEAAIESQKQIGTYITKLQEEVHLQLEYIQQQTDQSKEIRVELQSMREQLDVMAMDLRDLNARITTQKVSK